MSRWEQMLGPVRAELKVTDPNPRFSAKIFTFLRQSAVFCCRFLTLEFPGEGVNLRKSAFSAKSVFWARSVTLGLSPKARPEMWIFQRSFLLLTWDNEWTGHGVPKPLFFGHTVLRFAYDFCLWVEPLNPSRPHPQWRAPASCLPSTWGRRTGRLGRELFGEGWGGDKGACKRKGQQQSLSGLSAGKVPWAT